MEKGIIRSVALLCAIGGLFLAWAFGIFVVVPLRDGRLLSMSSAEMQVIGISFATGLLVVWGAIHLLSIADKVENPAAYTAVRNAYGLVLLVAIAAGAAWSATHIVSV